MSNIYEFVKNYNDKFDKFLTNCIQEAKNVYDSDSWTFENTKDYQLYLSCMKKSNENVLNIISNYHKWLLENFNVSPKN